MHKEAQQAAGGPTSLGTTRCDALADSTAKADLGISAPNEFIPKQDQTKSAGDGLKTAYTDLDMEIELLGDLEEILKKLKTFTSTICSLTSKVTVTLNRFASLINQSSQKTKDKGVPLASKSNDSSAEGEKNTYSATIEANLKKYLVDHTGIDVMEEYYKKKLLEDRTDEIISNFKVNDLHLAEWRE
nr:hypothetical protein [Tanacetum cinerariifolium]